jgi:hypothetical protein
VDPKEKTGLAVRVGGAVAAAAASIADPVAGLVAAGLVPAAEAAVSRWQAQQARNVENALSDAAEASGLGIDHLLDRLAADPTRLVFLSEALTAAARSTFSERIRALGRALASGALAADDAKVDEERLWVGILAAVEAPHLRILQQLVLPRDQQPHGTAPQQPTLAEAAGVSYVMAGRLLADLERHGLADWRWGETYPQSYPEAHGASASEKFWSPTRLTPELLDRFRAAGGEA